MKILTPEAVAPFFVSLYGYAWFVGFAIAFVVYLSAKLAPLHVLGRRRPNLKPPC